MGTEAQAVLLLPSAKQWAGWIAAGISSLFYVRATVALLVILSPDKISELNGFVEVADSAGKLLGAAWLSARIAILVIAGGVGFIGGNGTASSRLPYSAAVDGLLPKEFARLHPKFHPPASARQT